MVTKHKQKNFGKRSVYTYHDMYVVLGKYMDKIMYKLNDKY